MKLFAFFRIPDTPCISRPLPGMRLGTTAWQERVDEGPFPSLYECATYVMSDDNTAWAVVHSSLSGSCYKINAAVSVDDRTVAAEDNHVTCFLRGAFIHAGSKVGDRLFFSRRVFLLRKNERL